MRRLLILLGLLIIMMVPTTGALAQFQPDPPPDTVITCDDITESTRDTVAVMPFCGIPGDTAYLPFRLKNDSVVVQGQFLMEYDSTVMRPAFIHDTISLTPLDIDSNTFISHVVKGDHSPYPVGFFDQDIYPGGGRVQVGSVTTIPSPFGDVNIPHYKISVSRYESYNSLYVDSASVIAVNFLAQGNDFDTIATGNDVIMWVKFIVDDSQPDGAQTLVRWYEENIYYIDTLSFPPITTYFNGCNRAQMVVSEFDGQTIKTDTTFDINNTVDPPETTIVKIDTTVVASTYQRYPITRIGGFTVDISCPPFDPNSGGGGDPPVINSFLVNGASSASVAPSGSLVFSWNTTGATSIQIDQVGGSTVHTSTQETGQTTVTAPSTEDNYSYVLTASNIDGSVTRSVSVTVTTGGGGGTAPVITFNPPGGVYSIEQGGTLSVTVSATDPDGKQTTLTATSLPVNGTFTPNPAVGVPTASGTFSFTPDFNQTGSFLAAFTAQDLDGETSGQSVTIVVTELQYDRLFSTSAEDQAPVGGLPGTKDILFPVNLVTSQTVYGIQFDMGYQSSLMKVDSFIVSGRTPDWTIWDNIGDTPGQIRVISLGLANEPVQTDTTTAVMYAALSLDSANLPWTTLPIVLENGRESVDPDPNFGSLPLVTDGGIVEIDSVGDVNLDKNIDVGDAVSTVGTIIGDFVLTTRQFAAADIILDTSINVFDLVGIINSIFGYPVEPSPTPLFMDDPAVIVVQHDPLQAGANGMMSINTDLPDQVAGVQLEIQYNSSAVAFGAPSLTDDNSNFSLRYNDNGNSLKILLYQFDLGEETKLMQPGSAKLVDIPVYAKSTVDPGDKTKIRLADAMLSTASASSIAIDGVDPPLPFDFSLEQNYPNPFNPTTVIEFTIGAGTTVNGAHRVKLDVFNILGQQVNTLIDNDAMAPGTYTVTWDATNTNGTRVATGIYLYRLQVDDDSRAKKMIFLK